MVVMEKDGSLFNPVVVIGTHSTAALIAFFRVLPKECQCCFVVSGITSMPDDAIFCHLPIARMTGYTVLQSSHIYLIPPGFSASFTSRDTLQAERVHITAPIDQLFCSAAHERGMDVAAVILSGDGTDGVQGMKAIKDNGGQTWVQHPAEASPQDMPKNAICSVLIDKVLPLAKLPEDIHTSLSAGTLTDKVLLNAALETTSEAIVIRDARLELLAHTRAALELDNCAQIFEAKSNASPNPSAVVAGEFHSDQVTPLRTDEKPIYKAIMYGQDCHDEESFLQDATHPDGVFMSVSAKPIRDQAGNIIGGVSAAHDITSQKHLTRLLNRSDKQFEQLFEHASIGMSKLDANCQLIAVNLAFCHLLNYSRDFLENRDFSALIVSTEAPRLKNVVQEFWAGQTGSKEFECQALRQQGEAIWLKIKLVMQHNAAGEPDYLLVSAYNISEQKTTELQLRTSEKKFHSFFDKAPLGIAMLDQKGRIISSNMCLAKMLDYLPNELNGMRFNQLSPPVAKSHNRMLFAQLVNGEINEIKLETRLLDRTDNTVWVDISVVPVKYETEQVAQDYLVMMHEITKERLAQLEAFRQKKLLESIIQQADNAIIIRDSDFNLITMSQAKEAKWLVEASQSLSTEEPSSKFVSEHYGLFRPDGITRFQKHEFPLYRAIHHGESSKHWELMLRHPDAETELYFSVNTTPVKDEYENIIGGMSIFNNITINKQNEFHLKAKQQEVVEQNRLLTSIFEQTLESILILDHNFQVLFASPNAMNSLGNIGDVPLAAWQQTFGFFHADTLKPMSFDENPFYRCVAYGETSRNREILIHNQKTPHSTYFLLNTAPLLDEHGQISGAVTIFTDITEKKQVELELFRQKELLKSIISQSQDIIVAVDKMGKILAQSQPASILLEQHIGKPAIAGMMELWREHAFDVDRKTPFKLKELPLLRSITQGEIVNNQEVLIKNLPGNTEQFYLVSSSPFKGADDVIIGGVISLKDITSIKQNELVAQNQQLFLEAIINQNPCAIVAFDNNRNLITSNKALERLFGSPELLNSSRSNNESLAELYQTYQTDPENWQDHHNLLLRTFQEDGETPIEPKQLFSYRLLLKAASWQDETFFIKTPKHPAGRYFQSSGMPIYDAEGNQVGGILTFFDIHPIKMVEHSLREHGDDLALANLNLEQSNEELEQFAYITSHDLQEPLRTLAGFVDMLEEDYAEQFAENEDFTYITNGIRRGAVRMSEMVSGLLEYSRIGGNRTLKYVACNEIVEQVQQALAQQIADTNALIDVAPLPKLNVYSLELKLLFQNLLSNAIKYRKPDVPPHIKIYATSEKDYWLFTVEDNGIGIQQEFLEKIFLLFQRLHNRKKYAGAGIGLAHCKKIVNLHGGRIWAESEYGQGSCFKFTLPTNHKQGLSNA